MTTPGNKQMNYPEAISASSECARIAETVRDQIAKELGFAIDGTADWQGRTRTAVMTVADDQQTSMVTMAYNLNANAAELKRLAETWADMDDRAAGVVQNTTPDSSAAPTTGATQTVSDLINRPA